MELNEPPEGLTWTTFRSWYAQNRKKEGKLAQRWNEYKEQYNIKTKTKKKTEENTNKPKKTSVERRKKRGIKLESQEEEDKVVYEIDFIIKEKLIGDERKKSLKYNIPDEDWRQIEEIKEKIEWGELVSFGMLEDKPGIVNIKIIPYKESTTLKKMKSRIKKLTKEGIESVSRKNIMYYFT